MTLPAPKVKVLRGRLEVAGETEYEEDPGGQ